LNIKYTIIKILEKKDSRFVALIEYKNKQAIYKKITTNNKNMIKKFINEINILTIINKSYIPRVYEYGDDYIIMEYIESYNNKLEVFVKYMNSSRINKISEQLIDLNTSFIKDIKPNKNNLLFDIYKTILKLWLNKYLKIFHLKALIILTISYLKNKKLFNLPVITKGDFTEVNILINKKEIKFIDFDTYNSNGAWLQDASYLLLHQDIEVRKLIWQKKFFKKYISDIDKKYIMLNNEYIRFWLLYTAINQFSIRFFQNKHNLASIGQNELIAKEEHILYFLDNNKFNIFLNEIGFKI